MRTLFSIVFCFLFIQLSVAQNPDSVFVHHVFDSKAFDAERKVTVHLPSRYIKNKDEAMMVTYILDAQGPQYFNMLVGNFDYLTSRYGIIPTIVVGIHSPDRYAEFTPPAREGTTHEWDAKLESKLPNLYEHLEKEVFPWIEANFRTKPFRAIVGHSRGGSFVVQSLFDGHKDLFDAYLAISPALQFDDFQSIDMAKQSLQSKVPMNKFFYCSSGDVGENEIAFNEHVNKLDKVIKANPDPSLEYHRLFFPDMDHFTTVIPSLNQGLVLMKNHHMASFENIYEFAKNSSIPITDQIDAFLKDRKDKNIYVHEPGMRYFSYAASEFYEMEDYKNALDMYLWIDKNEPIEKWWEILNIGVCYKELKQKEKSPEYFDLALDKLENWKAEYGERFEEIKKDVQQQVKDHMAETEE